MQKKSANTNRSVIEVNKNILIQYSDLQEEIKDLGKRVSNLKKQIKKIEDDGAVIDSVSGGEGGIQHFKIKGFPYPEYSHKKTKLYIYMTQMENFEQKLKEQVTCVEKYIQSMPDSGIRQILRLRYIKGLKWEQVARELGYADESAARKRHDRYFDRNIK